MSDRHVQAIFLDTFLALLDTFFLSYSMSGTTRVWYSILTLADILSWHGVKTNVRHVSMCRRHARARHVDTCMTIVLGSLLTFFYDTLRPAWGQYSICGKARGGRSVFLIIFNLISRESMKTWGLRSTRGRVIPPPTIWALPEAWPWAPLI